MNFGQPGPLNQGSVKKVSKMSDEIEYVKSRMKRVEKWSASVKQSG